MTKNMQAFLELALSDRDYWARLAKLSEDMTDAGNSAIIELAREKNFALHKEDFESPVECAEIDEEVLAKVTGGGSGTTVVESYYDEHGALVIIRSDGSKKICKYGYCIGT